MSFVLAQFLFESTQILIWITTRWVIAFKLLFSWIPEVGRGSILSHLSVFSNKIIYFHIQRFTCRFLLELTDTCCHHRAWGPCGADTRSNPGWGLGARGPQDKTWGREEERSPCRFELHIGSSWSTDQAGWQMFTASPNECRECGWEVPVYGLCGSSYFPDPPHLLCLWGSNLPQLFSLAATSHAAWEGGMGSTFDHTFSWGSVGSFGGRLSKANYWAENFCWESPIEDSQLESRIPNLQLRDHSGEAVRLPTQLVFTKKFVKGFQMVA